MTINRTHYLTLIWVSLFMFLMSLLAWYFLPRNMVSENLLYIVPFFFLVGIAGRYLNSARLSKDPRKALTLSLAASGGKLFIYMAILTIYGYFNREDAAAFFINFLIIYLIFTFTELRLTLWEATK